MYSNDLVCQILDFLDDNLYRKFSVEELSSRFYYNRYYIMKLFKKELGITMFTYINQMRIIHSIRDIQNTAYSLTRIAIQNGFYSLEYFSETFHKYMGVSPRVYQMYWNYRFQVNETNLQIISEHWAELQAFANFIREYKKNQKPVGVPALKRSIF